MPSVAVRRHRGPGARWSLARSSNGPACVRTRNNPVQQSFADDEGRRLRPDVIVNMPGGQRMVVDAKVSLTAFEKLVNAGAEQERAVHLQRHLASVRNHIITPGSKEYHSAAGTKL